jgi:hypothetical protein
MNRKIINSPMAILSTIIILLVVCSQCAGIAGSQQYPQQYTTGDNSGSTFQPTAGDTTKSLVMQGLEGLKGFTSGHGQLSLAIIPVSQKNSQMTFQVVGFAISSPESGEAVIYSLTTPLQGIIDPSQNTMQIDISSLDAAVSTVGYIDSSMIYDTMRSDPQVVIIDVDMAYQGKQDLETIFNVNAIDLVPPNGKMQTYSMQQPTQLIVDKQNDRVAMVAFPEMVDTFGGYYGVTYSQVEPVVYSAPVPILAPVFVPYIRPIPIFYTGYVHYNAFQYGTGFRTFYDRDRITGRDRFTNADRYPIRQPKNDYADRARNDLVSGQRKGEFTQNRNTGAGIKGGVGGYRGGAKKSAGGRTGGGRTGGGRRR